MATMLEERTRARLRQLRFQRGLSLGSLAHASGLAASTVSRLETGARRLTLAHVERLARALDVPTDTLLATGGSSDPSPGRDGRTWEAIGPERPDGARVFRIVIPDDGRPPVLHGHEGHVWLYVLDGRLRLVVDAHELMLGAGGAAEFRAWRPHWMGAVGGPADVLAVFTPGGEPLRPVSPPQNE
jgi:transcriptional regulator with XRE-family HTH domain